MVELEKLFKDHDEETQPLRERFIKLETRVEGVVSDLTEVKTQQAELAHEVRQDRAAARRERKIMMRLLQQINGKLDKGGGRS